jgi:hypothetical protein
VRERPLVSIVLLSYDRLQYLWRVLETVLAQTGLDFEVIVVDNRSPASWECGDDLGDPIARAAARAAGVPAPLRFPAKAREGYGLGILPAWSPVQV